MAAGGVSETKVKPPMVAINHRQSDKGMGKMVAGPGDECLA